MAIFKFLCREIESKQRVEVFLGRRNREAEFGATNVAGICVTKYQREKAFEEKDRSLKLYPH